MLYNKNQTERISLVGPRMRKPVLKVFAIFILKFARLILLYEYVYRPPDKSAYLKIIFLISQPKHMFWVLKRTVSMRRFF